VSQLVLPMDENRCNRRHGILASFDEEMPAFYKEEHLCPLSDVKDRCVWIGLFKPWFNWPHLGTRLYSEV